MRLTGKEILEATGGTLLAGDAAQEIGSIALDSRKAEDRTLFIPVIGARVDGHDYIKSAFEAGMAASLTSRGEVVRPDRLTVGVPDTVKALQDIGRYARGKLDLPIIGVTGSVGKTTAREMIAQVMRSRFDVFSTSGNHNGQLGLPIMLAQIEPHHTAAVLEMGMSMPGEMTVLGHMARVSMAVMTNIGVSHIENLGSQENIFREKIHILDGSAPDAPLLINGDDTILREMAPSCGHPVISFGLADDCDYRAEDVSLSGVHAVFTLVCRGKRIPVTLSVPGTHNVRNALAAIAVGCENGIEPEEAAAALRDYTGFSRRLEVSAVCGRTVIDDAYNASPSSMKAALEVLTGMNPGPGGRRIAVLADMLELGPDSPAFHREVAEYADKVPDCRFILCGPLAGAMKEVLGEKTEAVLAGTESAEDVLLKLSREGDVILFKGSNGMHLDRVIRAFKEGLTV